MPLKIIGYMNSSNFIIIFNVSVSLVVLCDRVFGTGIRLLQP